MQVPLSSGLSGPASACSPARWGSPEAVLPAPRPCPRRVRSPPVSPPRARPPGAGRRMRAPGFRGQSRASGRCWVGADTSSKACPRVCLRPVGSGVRAGPPRAGRAGTSPERGACSCQVGERGAEARPLPSLEPPLCRALGRGPGSPCGTQPSGVPGAPQPGSLQTTRGRGEGAAGRDLALPSALRVSRCTREGGAGDLPVRLQGLHRNPTRSN